MDVTNFYIALYYQKRDAIRFVYAVDTRDDLMVEWIENFTEDKTLTGEVILKKEPMFLKEEQLFRWKKKE